MLSQRKAELGRKTVTKVTIFESEKRRNSAAKTMLVFYIEDVPVEAHAVEALRVANANMHIGPRFILVY